MDFILELENKIKDNIELALAPYIVEDVLGIIKSYMSSQYIIDKICRYIERLNYIRLGRNKNQLEISNSTISNNYDNFHCEKFLLFSDRIEFVIFSFSMIPSSFKNIVERKIIFNTDLNFSKITYTIDKDNIFYNTFIEMFPKAD